MNKQEKHPKTTQKQPRISRTVLLAAKTACKNADIHDVMGENL